MLKWPFFIFEQGKIYKSSKPRQGKFICCLNLLQACCKVANISIEKLMDYNILTRMTPPQSAHVVGDSWGSKLKYYFH